MTEAVCEDDVAALVHEADCLVIAGGVLGNIGADDILDSHFSACGLECIDKVLVICAVFTMQADETELDVLFCNGRERHCGIGGSFIARDERDCDGCHERQNKHKCQNLFLHSYLRILCLSAY